MKLAERYFKLNKLFQKLPDHDRAVLRGAFDSASRPSCGCMPIEVPEGFLVLFTDFAKGQTIQERLYRFEELCRSVYTKVATEAEKSLLANLKHEIYKLLEKSLTKWEKLEKEIR
jgi:hypothetical protein